MKDVKWLRMGYEKVEVGRLDVFDTRFLFYDDAGEMCRIISVVYHKLSKEFLVSYEKSARRVVVWLKPDDVVYRRVFSPITDGDDDDLRGAAAPEVA